MSRIFGSIHQNGYVVRDLDAAIRHWTEVLGVGPFFYLDRIKMDYFRYRGKDSSPLFSVAVANSGDLQIELIQQHNDEPSMYRDFLNAGREGLQHIAYRTERFDRDYARLIEMGYKVGQEGQIAGGSPNGRFVYFDTETHGGTVVELTVCVPGSPKAAFYQQIRDASRNWDGKDPVRRFELHL